MMDIEQLHRELAKAILAEDGRIDQDAAAFVRRFLASLPEGRDEIPPDAQAGLTAWLDGVTASLRPAIEAAIALGAQAGVLADAKAAELAGEAFTRKWPDGLTLSKRLWAFKRDTQAGVEQAVRDGVRQMKGVGAVVYDMQRAVEREAGTVFEIVNKRQDDWVTELAGSAKELIRNPQAKAQWIKTVSKIRGHVEELAQTGTRSAAERALAQIAKAAKQGNAALVDEAVKWWVYDRQLYNLKRIARTEMADAGHQAIIASTEGDEFVVGYQWRLSASHPRPDICEWYANVEMGLGRGVWPKGQEPKHKAHPHCVLGGTVIRSPGAIAAAAKSFYQGRIVEIVTGDSRRLSCTLNHPILTDSGWVAAQFLQPGQKVLTAAKGEAGALYPDNGHMPARIEQIFDALLEAGRVSARAVPVAPEQFHGDGRLMDGDVQIVQVDGLLLSEGDAGKVAGGNLLFRELDFSGDINARRGECFIEGFPVDALGGGNAVDGFAGLITLDEIVEVGERDFSGFVYDLQIEPHHWYFANGIVAHNCMCLLVPRVTPVKQPGSKSYAEFIRGVTPERRAELLPQWAAHLEALGMPLDKLVRPDGLGLATRGSLAARMGEDALKAAETLGRALAGRQWPQNTIKPTAKMARKTLDALDRHRNTPEVGQFLQRLAADGYKVASRDWHYFKYKYQYGDMLASPDELDARFEEVLRDSAAKVYHGGERYIVHSAAAGRIAVVSPSGERITVYQPDSGYLNDLKNPLWDIHTLRA